eukprot:TRINITY_DN5839_c0_g1_i1.p1 TRINITY_DN5839_c0_g1~~TRINITY_DN5839_c0_g1_i1.p1  ORF type:complete len:413 (-),score=82.06 TRINITY_DN5839_c0_g1_i1:27-1202(-)
MYTLNVGDKDLTRVLPEHHFKQILPNNPIFIGRSWLNQKNQQISRKQLEVTATSDGLIVKRLGINPGKAIIKGIEMDVKKGEDIICQHGDSFSLILDEVWFEVKSDMNTKKRKREEKTLCKYGEKCYRKNKDHLAKYSHPHQKKQKKLAPEHSEEGEPMDIEKYEKNINIDALFDPLDDGYNGFVAEDSLPIPEDLQGGKSLAFPCLGITDHNIDMLVAARVLVESVNRFLSDNEGEFRLVLVENNPDVINIVKQEISDGRFSIVEQDNAIIVNLKTLAGSSCSYIVNESDWRLKSYGSLKINNLVHQNAGNKFSQILKDRYNTANVGDPKPVPLQNGSSLLKNEDVYWVISVVPPNLNPSRPDVIQEDLLEEILRNTYMNTFKRFQRLLR